MFSSLILEMDNCIFCKIVKKEIPCQKVYEDQNFLAFLDIRPLNAGHTLIIPKKHYRWVWDIQEEYSAVVNKIALALKKVLGTDYVQSVVMGDEVAHAHIHLIPRFPHDGHQGLPNLKNIKELDKEELSRIADRIRKALL